MSNDTDVGVIERAKPKSATLAVPEHWYSVIENSRIL
jgi:hypothetical protein